MNEGNSFIKSKKGQFLVAGSVAAVLVIVIIVVMVSTIGSYFEDPLAQQNAANIGFNMELTENEDEQKNQKENLDDYVDKANRTQTIVSSKELNFSPNNNNQSQSEEGKPSIQRSSSNMSEQEKMQMVSNILNGSSSSSSFRAQQQVRQTNSANKSLRPQEREDIQNQIDEIYNKTPVAQTNRSEPVRSNRPSDAPEGQSAANRVIERTMSGNTISKEQLAEDELQSRRRRMMGDASAIDSRKGSGAGSRSSNTLYPCIIHGTQRVKENQTVILRLTKDLWTDDNVQIPKNTILYGTLSRGGNDRVRILISAIKMGSNVHPLRARIMAADGQEGIRISNTAVAQQATDKAINQIGSTARTALQGNVITSTVAEIATALVSGSSREKQLEVTLIENIKLYIQKTNE